MKARNIGSPAPSSQGQNVSIGLACNSGLLLLEY
jgi:hypothetical protein